MRPEFSRPERLDTIGGEPRDVAIAADPAECAGLATRFGLLSVEALTARFAIRRDGAGVLAAGRVEAAVTQACVATGEPLPARIDEPVVLRFVEEGGAEEEVELTADALDTMPIEGGAIDLGEAAAETMALALDPFPRSPDAEAALREAGVLDEEAAARLRSPFGALAGLKGKLEG